MLGGRRGGLLSPAPAPWPGPSPASQTSSNLPYRNTQPEGPSAPFTLTETPHSWKPPHPYPMSLFRTLSAPGRGSSWSGRGGHLLAQSPAASALSAAAQLPSTAYRGAAPAAPANVRDSEDSHLPPPCADTSLRFRGQGAGRGARLCVTLTSPRLHPDQLPLGGQMAHRDTAVRGPGGRRIGNGGGGRGTESRLEGQGQRAEKSWL